jgi:hypothetical protein
MKNKTNSIVVKNIDIRIKTINGKDYVSLTDLAKQKNSKEPRFTVQNWIKAQPTLGFLEVWESFNNPDFNRVQMNTVKKESFENYFTMTPKRWIEEMNATGIISTAGRYSETYAHKDIAFEFGITCPVIPAKAGIHQKEIIQ